MVDQRKKTKKNGTGKKEELAKKNNNNKIKMNAWKLNSCRIKQCK